MNMVRVNATIKSKGFVFLALQKINVTLCFLSMSYTTRAS